jgi:hypothetical protein
MMMGDFSHGVDRSDGTWGGGRYRHRYLRHLGWNSGGGRNPTGAMGLMTTWEKTIAVPSACR